MATSSNRDVKMTLSVDTLGAEDIKKLQSSVAALAKEGGDAAPEFQALADEIGRLADQSDALQAFQKLSEQTGELSARQEAAAASAAEYNARLAALRAQTESATAAQRAVAASLEEARTAARATRDELATLTATTDAAGKAEEGYAAEVERLKLAKISQRAEIERLVQTLRQSNTAVAEAERAETKLEATYRRASAASEAAGAAVRSQQEALQQSATAAEVLGVSTTDLAASQAAVARSFSEVEQRAASLTERVDRLAQRERELSDIRAFQQQADDAKRLFDTASYAELFEQALARVAAAEREVAAAQAAVDWQREAESIVNAVEATQRLAREEEALLQVQRELANDRAMERQAQEAERLARQADQIRLFTQRLDELEAQERATADAAEQAGEQIRNAFGAVGVRSVEVLRAEIAEVRAAMETLRSTAGVTGPALQQAFASGNARIQELERGIREVTGQLTLADRAANVFKNSLGQIAAGNIIADGVGYLINKIKELGTAFLDVTVQTERMRKGLQAIYKDTAVAEQQFAFLRATANASGVSVGSISDAFLRFNAATKSANIPLSVTNDLFAAVTRAGATLGLTGDQVAGTLDALGQMASKGVVSMEELRQQLGDRLPGALSVAAQGLGITDQKLIALVESGKLATEDFFPAFAKGLKTMAGDTDTLSGAWQRFTNVLNEGAVAAGDAGGLTLLKLAVQALAIAFGTIAVPLQGFAENLNLAVRGLRVYYETLRGNGKAAQDEFQVQVEKSAERIRGLQKAIDEAVGSTTTQTGALQANGVAQATSTTAVLQHAAANEKSAIAASAAGSAYVQQLVRLAENSAATEAAVTSSEKLLRARQDEGKALTLTAQLTGDASAALQANAQAATMNAGASEQVVVARTREVAVTQEAVAAINSQRDATGRLSSAKQQQLDKLNLQLTLQDAELEKARQSTLELGRQALAAQAAADAYADNSTKIASYQSAMENARTVAAILTDQVSAQTAALAELKDQLETGKITQEAYDAAKGRLQQTTDALNKATGDAARFENLYRDAVQDSISALDRKQRAASASLNVTLAQAKAEQGHYEVLAQVARQQGNEAQATEFSIQAKYKAIEAIRLSTRVRQLELDAQAAQIEIERAAIKPGDELAEQKRAELAIRLELIKAKRIEAGASEDVIRGIQGEIDAARQYGNQRAPGGGGSNGNRSNSSSANDGPKFSGKRGEYGADLPDGRTPGTFIGSDGIEHRRSDGAAAGQFTNTVPTDKAVAVRDSIGRRSYGPEDIAYLKDAQRQALDAKQFIDAIMRSSGAVSAQDVNSAQGLVTATTNALTEAQRRAQAVQQAAGTPGVNGSGGTTHRVQIDLGNGKTGTFGMASAEDASGLAGLLTQLGNAKKVH